MTWPAYLLVPLCTNIVQMNMLVASVVVFAEQKGMNDELPSIARSDFPAQLGVGFVVGIDWQVLPLGIGVVEIDARGE